MKMRGRIVTVTNFQSETGDTNTHRACEIFQESERIEKHTPNR